MKALHLFCPENDLALARNIANYTPPPAAAMLKSAGEALPLWYGNDGDRFVSSGINDAWLRGIQDTFGIAVEPFGYRTEGLRPAPWGWSRSVRQEFEALGFGEEQLPSDATLDRLRQLSHRRTAAALQRRLMMLRPSLQLTPAAVECCSVDAAMDFMDACPQAVFKMPWSSSGRGLMPVDPTVRRGCLPRLQGMIRRQGCVMAEPRHRRRSDFAFLFNMDGGKAVFRGLSLFRTEGLGIYSGNVLMPQPEMAVILREQCHADTFDALPALLCRALEDEIGAGYSGPLGVDMMTLEDSPLLAMTEINLRDTMGHLCLSLYGRYIQHGARGFFAVLPRGRIPQSRYSTRDGRLCGGTLLLTPPGGAFGFAVTLTPQA